MLLPKLFVIARLRLLLDLWRPFLLLLAVTITDDALPLDRLDVLPVFFELALFEIEAMLGRVVSAVSTVIRLMLLCVLLYRL